MRSSSLGRRYAGADSSSGADGPRTARPPLPASIPPRAFRQAPPRGPRVPRRPRPPASRPRRRRPSRRPRLPAWPRALSRTSRRLGVGVPAATASARRGSRLRLGRRVSGGAGGVELRAVRRRSVLLAWAQVGGRRIRGRLLARTQIRRRRVRRRRRRVVLARLRIRRRRAGRAPTPRRPRAGAGTPASAAAAHRPPRASSRGRRYAGVVSAVASSRGRR